ncbi:MAG: hypothetical protein WCC90_23315 [Methylocella sp.]
MAYSPQARGRSERVGQSVEPSPQALVFALAAFIFAPFVAAPFVLFLLIFVQLPAAFRHPSCSPA